MKRLFILLALAGPTGAVAADCLAVSQARFEPQEPDVGGFAVEWSARIENRCNAAFDADISIHFRDAAGERLYEVRDRATLSFRETRDVGKRVYIPSDYSDVIEAIDIRLDERERPL